MIPAQTPAHFHGAVRKSAAVGEFFLSETAYPPRASLGPHAHRKAYVCLVLRGNFTESCGSVSRACVPSTVVFHPPGETHSDKFDDAPARCFNFQIGDAWLGRIRDYSAAFDAPAHFHGGPLAQLAARLYREFRAPDALSPLAAEGLLLELVVAASRRRARHQRGLPPRWLERAREFLHAQFSEQPTLAQLAESAGVHPVHLARAFRAHFGCTVGEYLRRLRVEAAGRALANTDRPVVAVSCDAGFSSQSHFSTTFKRATGMTPAQYRAAFRPR